MDWLFYPKTDTSPFEGVKQTGCFTPKWPQVQLRGEGGKMDWVFYPKTEWLF